MRKILLVLLLVSFVTVGYSQFTTILVPHSADPEIKQLVAEGTKYLYGAGGYEQNYTLAFEILTQAAKEDEPIAHLLLAKMYEQGAGVKMHPQKAYKHYKLAAEGGEKAGMLELGKAYKKGKGVGLNFKQAVKYFRKSSDKDSPRAHYALGYMCFKGFGTEQNYEMAATLFDKSAEKQFPPGVFMLGVCYELGYGVTKNLGKAIECYEFAAQHNYKQAKARLDELNISSTKSAKKKTDQLHDEFLNNGLVPKKYNKVGTNFGADLNLSGKWEGELLIYDWSGKDIIARENISINLKQNGFIINANWNSTLTHDKSSGFVQGNEIHFDELNLVAQDIFRQYILKDVSNMTLMVEHTDSATYLSGNLETYLPNLKEPGPPAYILLKGMANHSNVIDKTNVVETGITTGKSVEPLFNIYPNPFKSDITIHYEVVKAGTISINVYNNAGAKIKEVKSDEYCSTGQYSINTSVETSSGSYIVEIVQDGIRQTRKIIKN